MDLLEIVAAWTRSEGARRQDDRLGRHPQQEWLGFFFAIPFLQSIESRDTYYITIMLVILAPVFMAHLGRPVGKLGANAILGVSMAAAKAAAQARGHVLG